MIEGSNTVNKLTHITVLFVLLILTGCTTPKPAAPSKTKAEPIITAAQPVTVSKDTTPSLDKVDWSKYSEYTLFSFYLILLLAACVYFKKTGKRLSEIETPLTTMAPKLSTRAKILSLLAKVIGRIYCKKK